VTAQPAQRLQRRRVHFHEDRRLRGRRDKSEAAGATVEPVRSLVAFSGPALGVAGSQTGERFTKAFA